MTSPFLSLTELGNIFARTKFNLPTIDSQKTDFEFTSMFSLLNLLSQIGEQNALEQKRPGIRSIDTLIAAACLFETLFNKRTIGERTEHSTNVLIDNFAQEYLFDVKKDLNLAHLKENNQHLQKKFAQYDAISDDQMRQLLSPTNNIICSFDILHMVGWKYHESQQKPKSRGSSDFSLREVVDDLNDQEEIDEFGDPMKVQYGVIIDDGDNVEERDRRKEDELNEDQKNEKI